MPSVIPVGGYAGWQTLIDYGDLTYKPTGKSADEIKWDLGIAALRNPANPTGKEGQVAHGNFSGFDTPAPLSMQKTSFVNLTMFCWDNEMPDQAFSTVISLIAFSPAQTPDGSLYYDTDITNIVPNTSSIEINCTPQTPTTTASPTITPTPTDTPTITPTITPTPTPTVTPTPTNTPIIPSVGLLSGPPNLFLQLPPPSCLAGTDGIAIPWALSRSLSDPGSDLRGFQFEIHYDQSKVCVVLFPGSAAVLDGMNCTIQDSSNSALQGLALMDCLGPSESGPFPDTKTSEGRQLALLIVRPQPGLYGNLSPRDDSSEMLLLDAQACNLVDAQLQPIGFAACQDFTSAIRFLAGDVFPDCIVDTKDTQLSSFRIGATAGHSLYDPFTDIEGSPAPDGDIDMLDAQAVLGRFGSSCGAPLGLPPPVVPQSISLTIMPDTIPVTMGQEVVVMVDVGNMSEIGAYDIGLEYDSNLLTYKDSSLGFGSGKTSCVSLFESNPPLPRFSCGIFGLNDSISGSGTLASITFTASQSGPATFSIDAALFGDSWGQEVFSLGTLPSFPVDSDGDGIDDEIDDDPAIFSSDFSDVSLGGDTSGQVTDRTGLNVLVHEAPNPDGVRIEAVGSGGQAEVDVCSNPTVSYLLDPGEEIVVTCGSVTTKVLVGPVTAQVGTVLVSLPAGAEGKEVTDGDGQGHAGDVKFKL
ncbi:MAG: hypothetical protein IIC64_10760 [SAR324 cluster bacterium]|nr:hypothetical protein [SAR324 cluster bacterium]